MTPTDIIRQALATLPDNSPPDTGAPFILLDGRDSRLICPRVLRGWIRHLLAEVDGRDAEIRRLAGAISQTLEENAHLADGDNCTLIALRQTVTPETQPEFSLTQT